ncbi:MAG: DUF2807 domain-containing protein [Bacteroidaceae bacterium]|nr:DUF2807 domain-containing protein [Bacteroidaceae bacterium]
MRQTLQTLFLSCVMMVNALSVQASGGANIASTASEDNSGVVARMDLPAFTGVYSDLVASITIEKGDKYFVEAHGPEHLIQLIEPVVEKEGGTLTLKAKREYKTKKQGITIRVVTPQLDLIYNEGVGDIRTKGDFKTQMMTITNEGVGNITIADIECERLQVLLEGVGKIIITGKATHAVFKSEGVGGINAYGLQVANLNAELEGVGGIECNVTERFTCSSEGVGSIYYMGNPKQTNIKSNGIGKVVRK